MRICDKTLRYALFGVEKRGQTRLTAQGDGAYVPRNREASEIKRPPDP